MGDFTVSQFTEYYIFFLMPMRFPGLLIWMSSFDLGQTWKDCTRATFTTFITAGRPSVHPNRVLSVGWAWQDTRLQSFASVKLNNITESKLISGWGRCFNFPLFFKICPGRNGDPDHCVFHLLLVPGVFDHHPGFSWPQHLRFWNCTKGMVSQPRFNLLLNSVIEHQNRNNFFFLSLPFSMTAVCDAAGRPGSHCCWSHRFNMWLLSLLSSKKKLEPETWITGMRNRFQINCSQVVEYGVKSMTVYVVLCLTVSYCIQIKY